MSRGTMWLVFLVGLISIIALSNVAYASTAPCSDGTEYFKCSKTQIGFACLPDSSTGANTLQLYTVDAQGKPGQCACSKFPGYSEGADGTCMKTTCTAGSATVNNGQCYNFQKCSNGQLVDDAATCGCASGKKTSSDGKTCVENSDGCRWPKSAKCLAYQECKYENGSATDSGTCTNKQGCQYATYNGQACDIYTETCNQQTGKCDKVTNKCNENKDCTGGKVCNLINHACEAPQTVTQQDAGAPILGGGAMAQNTTAPAAPSQDAQKGGIPCCAPIGLGMAALGIAFSRKGGK